MVFFVAWLSYFLIAFLECIRMINNFNSQVIHFAVVFEKYFSA